MLATKAKTGFFGLCIESALGLFDLLVKDTNSPLQFLLFYKVSQDHLELFFSVIRNKGGNNDNPTTSPFESAYKRLLVHHEVTTSNEANAIAIDETSILHVSSAGQTNPFINKINFLNDRRDIFEYVSVTDQDHSYTQILNSTPNQLTRYVSNVVKYISDFVVKKLQIKKIARIALMPSKEGLLHCRL